MEGLLNYDGLIYSIIKNYPKKYDREDLYQVAMLGLIDAYRHYDEGHDTKFSTFAYYYIVGEVNKYIRECSTVKVSRSLIELKKKVLKTKEMMEQRLGREITNLEVSLYLEVEESMIDMALIAGEDVSSIDDSYEEPSVYDDTSPTLLDLRSEIEKLSPDERKLLEERYYNELTQMETSNVLGISQVQVSRREGKILEKLKSNLSS